MQILVAILSGIIIGLIIGLFLWRKKNFLPSLQNDNKLIAQKEAEKQANLEKVKTLIASQEKITNDDVQNLLKISDATAERYLDELEAQGLIRQVGKTGVKTYYEKVIN